MTTRKNRHRRLNLKRIISSSLGATLGIACLAYLSSAAGIAFLLPPFGATCFIAFVIPDSAFARPRNIIGGHLCSSAIGLLYFYWVGPGPLSYALATGCALAAMQLLRIQHPPAAANPLLILLQNTVTFDFLLMPVLSGSIVLALFAKLFHKTIAAHRYYRISLFHIVNGCVSSQLRLRRLARQLRLRT